MRKSFITVLMSLLLLAGCSAPKEQDAVAVAEQFKKTQYTITDYTKLSDDYAMTLTEQLRPSMTVDKYQKFAANREAGLAAYYAANQKCNIQVTSVKFEKYNEEKQNHSLDYNYTLNLKVSGNIDKTISKTGQLTMVNEDGKWKISRDSDQKLQPSDFK